MTKLTAAQRRMLEAIRGGRWSQEVSRRYRHILRVLKHRGLWRYTERGAEKYEDRRPYELTQYGREVLDGLPVSGGWYLCCSACFSVATAVTATPCAADCVACGGVKTVQVVGRSDGSA